MACYAVQKKAEDFQLGKSAQSTGQELRRLALPKSLDAHQFADFLEGLFATGERKQNFRRLVSNLLEEFSAESSVESEKEEEEGPPRKRLSIT